MTTVTPVWRGAEGITCGSPWAAFRRGGPGGCVVCWPGLQGASRAAVSVPSLFLARGSGLRSCASLAQESCPVSLHLTVGARLVSGGACAPSAGWPTVVEALASARLRWTLSPMRHRGSFSSRVGSRPRDEWNCSFVVSQGLPGAGAVGLRTLPAVVAAAVKRSGAACAGGTLRPVLVKRQPARSLFQRHRTAAGGRAPPQRPRGAHSPAGSSGAFLFMLGALVQKRGGFSDPRHSASEG